MEDEIKKLTLLQERFCNEYIIDGNATRSVIAAGYAESVAGEQGYENLKLPHISERIAQLESDRLSRVQISADYVLANIKDIAERAAEADEYQAALRGYEKLGAHLQLFIEQSETKIEQTIRLMADDDVVIPP